jgi:hypothetical protein
MPKSPYSRMFGSCGILQRFRVRNTLKVAATVFRSTYQFLLIEMYAKDCMHGRRSVLNIS